MKQSIIILIYCTCYLCSLNYLIYTDFMYSVLLGPFKSFTSFFFLQDLLQKYVFPTTIAKMSALKLHHTVKKIDIFPVRPFAICLSKYTSRCFYNCDKVTANLRAHRAHILKWWLYNYSLHHKGPIKIFMFCLNGKDLYKREDGIGK